MEQARLFIERLKTDEAFREKIMTVEDAAGRLQLAKAEGYDCTAEKINTVSAKSIDGELEGVSAAGVDFWWLKKWCHGTYHH